MSAATTKASPIENICLLNGTLAQAQNLLRSTLSIDAAQPQYAHTGRTPVVGDCPSLEPHARDFRYEAFP
eukprot:699445-Amphidinium_carterae.3